MFYSIANVRIFRIGRGSCVRFFGASRKKLHAESHYDVLGIEKEADIKEIREAYIKKCKEFHPDKNVDNKDSDLFTTKFKRATEAYEILGDKKSREDYDESLINKFSSDGAPSYSGYTRYRDVSGDFRERARAYGHYPAQDDDYFNRYSPSKIAIACVFVAVGSFFVHFYIAYLGYEKHNRYHDEVSNQIVKRGNYPMWMNYAAKEKDYDENDYSEEAIAKKIGLDSEEAATLAPHSYNNDDRGIDAYRRFKILIK